MEKFYTYLSENERQYLSLNFLLSEKIFIDNFVSNLNIKGTEQKAESSQHHNKEFFCMLCNKHISRYVDDIEAYDIERM